MKSSLRAALAVGALALASSQASAASIPYASISVFNGMPSTSLFTGGIPVSIGNPVLYELDVISASTISVSYEDTILDDGPGTIKYELFSENLSGALNLVTEGGSLMTAVTFVDPAGGTWSKLLGLGQYVLKITHAGAGTHTSQSSISAVPLPAAAWLFGSALLGFGALRRKQKAGNSEMALA